MHLVCHETIPGSGYSIGDKVTDQAAITAVLENSALASRFSQVPDGTFTNPAPQRSNAPAPPAPPSSNGSSS